MTELKHWLDEGSDADEFERSILRAGLDADPPQVTQDQIWSSLTGSLAIAPVLAATAAVEQASAKAAAVGIGKAGGVWLAVAKGFIVGLAVYGAIAGVSEISNEIASPPAPTAATVRVLAPAKAPIGSAEPSIDTTATPVTSTIHEARPVSRTAPRGSVSASAPSGESRQTERGAVASFEEPGRPSGARVSQLEGETRALRRARDELRAGKLADAFASLEASRRQFSAPELYQEREALMIELLFRSGQRAVAAQRARDFLGRFPESPHAQQIQTLLR
jgi:hypothetical protein